VIAVEIAGDVGEIDVAGGVIAEGHNSDAILHVRGSVVGLDSLSVRATHGEAIVRTA